MRIGERVGMRLVHILSSGRTPGTLTGTTTLYRVQVAWVGRPANGVRSGTLRCAMCGEQVGFLVRSVAATRARKRYLLLASLLAAAVLTVLIFVVIHMETTYPQGNPLGAEVATLLGLAIAVLVLAFCLLMLPGEDGVTMDRKRGTATHTFRPLNLRLAWRRPDSRNFPANQEITFDDVS